MKHALRAGARVLAVLDVAGCAARVSGSARVNAGVVIVVLVVLSAFGFAQEYDHDEYDISGIVTHDYIGCEEAEEINRVFRDFGGTVTKSAAASLALRGCVFIDSASVVRLVRPGASINLGGAGEVRGYFITTYSDLVPVVWFPYQFIGYIREKSKHPEQKPEPEPPPEPEMMERLNGPLPIGRWALWLYFDPKKLSETNSGVNLGGPIFYREEFELTEDRLGKDLVSHGKSARPDGGFKIPELLPFVWTYGDEFSWKWRNGVEDGPGYFAWMTTAVNSFLTVVESDDFVFLRVAKYSANRDEWYSASAPLMMVRIGSDLFNQMWAFVICVKENRDRAIHKIETCDIPFEFEPEKMPPLRGK